jgi:prepilin-type N-terminal cleavage/methylation domain-containing protein
MKPACAGFSLIELLVVIGIIAIMAAAGAMALGGGGGKSLGGSAAVASSVFTLARTEAIMRRVPVRVIVDADNTSQKPENFLRRMAVIYSTNSGTNWDAASKWTMLPGDASFHTVKSTKQSMTYGGLPGAFGAKTFYYYQFEPNGQMNPASQFVVSPSVGGTDRLYGFKIHRMGKMTFFDSPADIPDP